MNAATPPSALGEAPEPQGHPSSAGARSGAGSERGPAQASRPRGYRRSKTATTWITFLFGSIGLHRFYLHGWRDPWGWLYIWPTLVGVYGVLRIREIGLDDRLSWVLIPVLGLMLSATMLRAILYGLMSDEAWHARFPDGPMRESGLLNVIGLLVTMFVGSIVLISTIAFGAQCFFEYQMNPDPQSAAADQARAGPPQSNSQRLPL